MIAYMYDARVHAHERDHPVEHVVEDHLEVESFADRKCELMQD